MRNFIFLSLLLTTASAGNLPLRELEGRITNGDSATRYQFPHQVGLVFRHEGHSRICGGTIISDRLILTAAHCTSIANFGIAHVREQRIHIFKSNIWTHASYDPSTNQNDISLINLPVPVKINDFIQLADLPKKTENKHLSYEGKFVWASDWDAESDNVTSDAKGFQFIEVSVVKNSECNRYYDIEITDKMICIEPPNGKSACRNSGGSLVYKDHNRNILVGVSSFDNKKCESGIPSVYTCVDDYLDWIEEVAGIVNE